MEQRPRQRIGAAIRLSSEALELLAVVCTIAAPLGALGPIPWRFVPLIQAVSIASIVYVTPSPWLLRRPLLRANVTLAILLVAWIVLSHAAALWDGFVLAAAGVTLMCLACPLRTSEAKTPGTMAAGILTVAISGLMYTMPQLQSAIEAIAIGVQNAGGALGLQDTTRFGPTVVGWPIVSLAGIYGLLQIRTRRDATRVLGILAAAALSVIGRGAWHALGPNSGFWALFGSGCVQATCLSLIAVVLTQTMRVKSIPSRRAITRITPIRVAVAICVVACGISLASARRVCRMAQRPEGVFAVLDEGLLDWKRPTVGNWGAFKTGMFGLLPDHLTRKGWQLQKLGRSELTPGRLAACDILCVINLGESLTARERRTVLDFVRGGGGLLVLGDHTDIQGVMTASNHLLEGTGIAFRFDSAVPNTRLGAGNIVPHPHVVGRGVTDPSRLCISIGATLAVSAPADPVISGVHTLSDKGIRENIAGSMLGNYELERGERYGDLVYVAESRLSAGAILVFGDTSPFQNSPLARTYYPFLDNVLTALAPASPGRSRLFFVPAALALAVGAVAFASRRVHAYVVVVILVLSLSAWAWSRLSPSMGNSESTGAADSLVIDSSHLTRVEKLMSRAHSLSGFGATAQRAGFHVTESREALTELVTHRHPRVVVSVAPTRSYSETEAQAVASYVESGGCFVFACGWMDSGAAAPLLREFGHAIMPIPLVRGQPTVGHLHDRLDAPTFVDAWAVSTLREPGSVDSLYRFGGHDIVVARRRGKGVWILIGDSRFLTDANLEGSAGFHPSNMQFVIRVLKEYAR